METATKPAHIRTPERQQLRAERARLRRALVYEMWHGKPVYHAGYQDVLCGRKTVEQAGSSSIVQSRLVTRLIGYLSTSLDMNTFAVLGNELGIQFGKSDWRACDVAIFTLADLADQDETKYAWVAPKVAIEVDTKADLDSLDSPFDYYERKTTQLLDFGVEKVIWLFTKSQKVWIAEANKDWIIRDWSQSVPVLADCQFVPDELMPPKK